MTIGRLRIYRHFPTLPDSQALLGLLRMNAILFETRYQKETYDRTLGRAPARLDVLVQAADYETVRELEAALTPEQTTELANYYFYIIMSEEELRLVMAFPKFPKEADIAREILTARKEYSHEQLTVAIPTRRKPASQSLKRNVIRGFLLKYGLLILLLLLLFLLPFL